MAALRTTRRRVLAFGVGGAAALLGGASLSWLTRGYFVTPGDIPIALSIKELFVVRALVDACHPGESDLPGGLSLGVHQRIDEEIWSQSEAMRSDLKASIQLLEHAPPLFGFAGRFSALAPAQRQGTLERIAKDGPQVLVQAITGLRQLAAIFYYGHEKTWSALGYDGPWQKKPQPPSSSQRYAQLLAQRRAQGAS